MEVLTTLIMIIGIVIMFFSKREVEKKKKSSAVSLKKRPQLIPEVDNETTYEDITKRHLEGDLKTFIEKEAASITAIDKIEKLSNLKKAIVWAEILDKPLSER